MDVQDKAFSNLRAAYDANKCSGPLQPAAEVRELVSRAMDRVQHVFSETGYALDQCDIAHACEAAIYAYFKGSNPSFRAVLRAAETLGEG